MADFGYSCTITFVEETQDYTCDIEFNGNKYQMKGEGLANISRFVNEFNTDVILPSANTELICED